MLSNALIPLAAALAERLVAAPFAAGDVITRQGAIAHWLYLLTGGEADVWIDSPDAPRRRVATLGPQLGHIRNNAHAPAHRQHHAQAFEEIG